MKFILSIGLLAFSVSSYATCYHNGVAYKTGETVGEYVCSADGTWRKK